MSNSVFKTKISSGVLFALSSAALFGASTPLSKILLGDLNPVLLAGLLYLSSGCGLTIWRLLRRLFGAADAHEASLKFEDLPWLAGAILAGGVIGLVGFLGYGVSLSLFILGLRHIGTARTGAYFSLAPFVGAVVSILVLGDKITTKLIAAAALMGLGVWLHLTEEHEHEHWHPPMVHEHRHSHDEHHQHEHEGEVSPGESHSHEHAHGGLLHRHPHYPDIHHRH